MYSLKHASESNCLKVNLLNTKVVVSKIGLINKKPSSKKDPCDIVAEK